MTNFSSIVFAVNFPPSSLIKYVLSWKNAEQEEKYIIADEYITQLEHEMCKCEIVLRISNKISTCEKTSWIFYKYISKFSVWLR